MFDRNLLSTPQTYFAPLFAIKSSKTQVLVPCCFHHDKTPSLSINMTTGAFYCFGCGAKGGDVLDFEQLRTGLNFVDTCKNLGAWADTKDDTPEAKAERKQRMAEAEKQRKILLEQAAIAEKAHAQAFIPLVNDILRVASQPMFSPPYPSNKGIGVHNLYSVDAATIQKFTLPPAPHESKKRLVTVCYGFEGVLTIAILETLDGEQVALQVFDGVPTGKKYARWFIGRPATMGAYYRLGDWTTPSVVLITEGVADAISCYEATGYPVLAALSMRQLVITAKAVHHRYPQALIVMCGDNDLNGSGERVANDAAKAVGGLVVIPKEVKDFNELHQVNGVEVVKMTIDAIITEHSRSIESKKAIPPSKDGTAPNTQISKPIIDDGGNGGEKKQAKPPLRVVTIGQLVSMDLPPRENLLSPWLPVQGLAMVYAPRGIGKTFFALNVAYALASGGEFLCWHAVQAQPVLYIDGEMPVISMQERLSSIITMHKAEANEDALRIITPDLQGDAFMPDLATIEGQQAIELFLEGVKLIVIDNISTLCRSGRENESEGWVTVQEWALRQRSAGRSVLFVHHAGKGGNQRGTSKREDVLDTVINLKRPIDYNPSEGASFEVHFEKARGFSGEDAEPLSCRLGHDEHNNLAWLYRRLEDTTFDKVVTLINEGLSQAEIASELDINKSNVSRHVKNARLKGLIQESKTKSKPINSANYSRVKDGE